MSQTVHTLSNLSSGHFFDLAVDDDTDPTRAAKTFLAGQGVDENTIRGFFISIFGAAADDHDAAVEDQSDHSRPGAALDVNSQPIADQDDAAVVSTSGTEVSAQS